MGSDGPDEIPSREVNEDLSREDLESLVEQKVSEKLEQEERDSDGGSSKWSRRTLLGTLGGTAAGYGLSEGPSRTQARAKDGVTQDFQVADLRAEQITVDTLEARKIIAENVNTVRIAESGDDIQRHIDDLHGTNTGTGPSQQPGGGVVYLKPGKTYKPTSPIVLKYGVHLVGEARNQQSYREAYRDAYDVSVISDENLSPGTTAVVQAKYPHSEPDAGHQTGLHNIAVRDTDGNVTNTVMFKDVTGIIVEDCLITSDHGKRAVFASGVFDGTIAGGRYKGGSVTAYHQQVDPDTDRGCQMWINGQFANDAAPSIINDGTRCKLIAANGHRGNIKSAGDTGGETVYAIVNNVGRMRITNQVITSNKNANLHGVLNHAQVHVRNSTIEKHDRGMLDKGTGMSNIQNCVFWNNLEFGLKLGNEIIQMNGVKIRSTGQDGLVVGNVQPQEGPVTNLELRNNGTSGSGYGIRFIAGSEPLHVAGFSAYQNASGPINDPSRMEIVGSTSSQYRNINRGTAVFSGDGSQTVFSVTHQLDEIPDQTRVIADRSSESPPVAGVLSKSFGPSTFDFEFESPPPSGSDNVSVQWWAWGPSAQ